MKAIEEYETGSNLLQNYKKKSVDTEGDCDYLKPAFENYVNGHMHENSFFGNIQSAINTFLFACKYPPGVCSLSHAFFLSRS
jgi:hypothetical protein